MCTQQRRSADRGGGRAPRGGARFPRYSPAFLWGAVAADLPLGGLWAQVVEPPLRGPGFYYSLVKIVLVLIVYLGWIATCDWINRDGEKVGLKTATWNGLMLLAGLLGLLAVWGMSTFFLGFLLLLLLYGGTTFGYVAVRNGRVPAGQRVLTEEHLRSLGSQLLGLKVKVGKASSARRVTEVGEEAKLPVRFIGRSADQREDPDRVNRAEGSKGYKAALRLVHDALQRRATDIHLEPARDEMVVRFRIDGILQATDPFSRPTGDAVINIFKVLGDLDITEKRKPQDGSFSAQVENRQIDVRIATAGSVVGEKLVMRVLDRSQQIISLTQLGMRDRMREQVHDLVKQPHGMFISCGPTGAGKSTTLYACLNEIDRYQQNVITIEDPVEFQLTNATQIEVSQRAGKTFASELRSILRQDPDVILVGEVRDKETAEIACQAAQTGHMVFTTLHANDTITAVGRLIDLGVQPFMLATALSGVLGQRLVRLLCAHCKVRYKPNPDMLRKLNLPADKIKYFYRPPEPGEAPAGEGGEAKPCSHCGGTGYHGRIGVFELLIINDNLRALIRESPNLTALKQEAVKNGLRFLQEDGMRQVIEGKTSIQELLRVSK